MPFTSNEEAEKFNNIRKINIPQLKKYTELYTKTKDYKLNIDDSAILQLSMKTNQCAMPKNNNLDRENNTESV